MYQVRISVDNGGPAERVSPPTHSVVYSQWVLVQHPAMSVWGSWFHVEKRHWPVSHVNASAAYSLVISGYISNMATPRPYLPWLALTKPHVLRPELCLLLRP